MIASTGRRGLRRLFDPGVVERLALITLGRAAGFTLNEITHMFAPNGRPRIDRQMLLVKAKELDRTISSTGFVPFAVCIHTVKAKTQKAIPSPPSTSVV